MNTWQAARKEVAHTSRHNQFSIGASASLWECMLSDWLGRLYQLEESLQFEARIAQRQSLVKQLHERQLDLLITTETPKMDEFSSQLLGHLHLASIARRPKRRSHN
jgi:DNA-binding transcriptional LysR family regulator